MTAADLATVARLCPLCAAGAEPSPTYNGSDYARGIDTARKRTGWVHAPQRLNGQIARAASPCPAAAVWERCSR